jgi:hypothetical protein
VRPQLHFYRDSRRPSHFQVELSRIRRPGPGRGRRRLLPASDCRLLSFHWHCSGQSDPSLEVIEVRPGRGCSEAQAQSTRVSGSESESESGDMRSDEGQTRTRTRDSETQVHWQAERLGRRSGTRSPPAGTVTAGQALTDVATEGDNDPPAPHHPTPRTRTPSRRERAAGHESPWH